MTTEQDRTWSIDELRFSDPDAIHRRLVTRTPFSGVPDGENLLVIAADHPARGALAVGEDPLAMADRGELLDRVVEALTRPGVHGVLGTADIIEELALRGAIEGKMVLGSMNRGGLAGASFELDDRFTGYDARGVAEACLDGGKMLLRLDLDDPASAATLEACAHAVDALAERRRIALVEPFMSRRARADGRARNDLSPEAVITAMAIASGLGRTSAYTWLKLPVVAQMERVMAATTLPTLILGGDVDPSGEGREETLTAWQSALALPQVRGLVAGRTLLYPPDGDVAGAVDAAVSLL